MPWTQPIPKTAFNSRELTSDRAAGHRHRLAGPLLGPIALAAALSALALFGCSIVIDEPTPDTNSAANPQAAEVAYQQPPSAFSSRTEAGGHADGPSPRPAVEPSATEALGYTCTMHPEVHQHEPGDCPECGMALVAKKPPREGGS